MNNNQKILNNIHAAYIFSLYELRNRYRRSLLGPFWITISISLLITSIGVIFGILFKSKLNIYLPYLAVGLITWTFIVNTISDSINCFIDSSKFIKQIPNCFDFLIIKNLIKNLLIFFHNIVVLPVILIIFDVKFNLNFVISFFGLIVLIFNLYWISYIAAIVSVRYRDVGQIITNILQVLFYFTPVIWMVESFIGSKYFFFIELNPFFNLIELIRGPILSEFDKFSYFYCIFFGLIGNTILIYIKNKSIKKISYWV